MRVRAEYGVDASLKFLGNFDMMHLMERALRRAKIPYSLTEGFNPHIKLSMGTILPVGVWGPKEYFDLEMDDDLGMDEFKERMNQVLPETLQIHACQEIPEESPSIMKAINAAAYTFLIDQAAEELEAIVIKILAKKELPIQSRGKNKEKIKDLRGGIFSIDLSAIDGQINHMTLMVSVNEPLNIRYDELLDLLTLFGIKRENVIDFYRQGNYIREKDQFYSPLERVR